LVNALANDACHRWLNGIVQTMPDIRLGLDAFLLGVQREYRFILATFSASGIGYLGTAAAPVIVNALIDSGLDHSQAGDLGTIELLTLAAASTLIVPYVPVLSHRKLAVGGTLMAIVGLMISALSVDYATMIVGRIAIGCGSGLAISGANAAIAAREDAERIFAIIWTMGGAITASLAMFLPAVVEGGRFPLGFAALLLLALLGLPFMFWLPHKPAESVQPSTPRADSTTTSGDSSTGLKTVFGPLVVMAFFGMFLYSAGEQALWNFAYNLPIEAGVDPELAAKVLGMTVFMGLGGGAIAALLGVRLGRIFPIVLGSLFSLAGRWMYINASTSSTLLVASLLWGTGFYFVSPYQVGLVAAVDRTGRAAVACAAASNFGYAVGPGIAGRIIQYMDREWLMLIIAGSTAASMLLFLPLAIRVDRDTRAARAAPARR